MYLNKVAFLCVGLATLEIADSKHQPKAKYQIIRQIQSQGQVWGQDGHQADKVGKHEQAGL